MGKEIQEQSPPTAIDDGKGRTVLKRLHGVDLCTSLHAEHFNVSRCWLTGEGGGIVECLQNTGRSGRGATIAWVSLARVVARRRSMNPGEKTRPKSRHVKRVAAKVFSGNGRHVRSLRVRLLVRMSRHRAVEHSRNVRSK